MAGGAVLLVLLMVWAFLPEAMPVQTAQVTRGPLEVVVEEEGETQVRDRFAVTAPTAGYLRRIELEAGDRVVAGQPLAEIEPPRAAELDARTRSEMTARLASAQAAVARLERQAEAAETVAAQAEAERARLAPLAADEVVTPQALEQAEAAARRAVAEQEAARAAVASARAEVRAVEATLAGGQGGGRGQVVRAPADGRVLAVHRRSEGPVSPGEPLIELGDAARLEVRVDVRSQDAVRLRPGMRVRLDQWGGAAALDAEVVRISPDGYTRVSSLGVEEQRVPVIAALTSPGEAGIELGSGYRVLAQFVVWEASSVLQVPSGAPFRTAEGWAVFVIENGRAARRSVELGERAGLQVEVRGGLEEGAVVITHPPTDLAVGDRVRPG